MRIIAGRWKNHSILCPKGREVRPSSDRMREAFFNICRHEVEGAAFLDLFAGSGAVGLEALSRGAKSATFVEKNREPLKMIKQNCRKLGIEEGVEVIGDDVFRALKKLEIRGRQFSLIFADPPYDQGLGRALLEALDRGSLLEEGGELYLEESLSFSPEEFSLENLQFVTKRPYGNSSLSHFRRRE